MHISEFATEEHARIEHFRAWWEAMAARDEKADDGHPIWPLEMAAGHWDEALLTFDAQDAQADKIEEPEAAAFELAAMAVRYQVAERVFLEKRDNDLWCVSTGSATLNTDFECEVEPSPSNRDDDYLSRNRFTLAGAMAHARAWLETDPNNALLG